MKSYLFFVWMFISAILCGQDYNISIKHLSTADGLSNQYANHVFQDNKGFIWISTAKGINRWDGYNMEIHAERMSITSAVEDKNGIIWINYNKKHSDFKIQSEEAPIHIGEIDEGFLYAKDWELLAKTKDGILLWSFEKKSAYLYTDKLEELPGLTHYFRDKKYRIAADPDSEHIWLLYDHEIILLDKEGKILDQEKISFPIVHFDMNQDDELFLHLDRTIDIKQNTTLLDSIYIFKKAINQSLVFDYSLPITKHRDGGNLTFHSRQFFRKKDKKGITWTRGHHFLSAQNETGKVLFDNLKMMDYGGGQLLSHVFFDNNENAWLATYDGVFSINLSNFSFESFLNDSTPGYSTRGMLKYNDSLLVHTYEGTQLVDVKNAYTSTPLADIPEATFFYTVLDRKDGHFYFGEGINRIFKYNKNTFRSQMIEPRLEEDRLDALQHLPYLVKSTNEVWIGTSVGLSIINEELQAIEYLVLHGEEKKRPLNVRHFYENERDLWVVARNGLFLVDPKERKLIAHFNKGNGNLPFDELNHVFEDQNGIFWIATQGYGLIEWNPETLTYRSYGREMGFLNLMVHAVYQDSYNRLWLPSDYGLVLFDKETKMTRIFLEQDGLSNNEFNGFSHYRDLDGILYFGGINGVNYFHPDSITNISQYEDPQLHITSLTLPDKKNSGQTINLIDQINKENELVLPPDNTSFTLQFSFLDYYSHPNISYAYKIEGLDNNWTFQRENRIRFASLPSGNYTLHIKAKGNTGLWTKNIIELPIKVLKPFYLTTTFILFLISLVALILFSYIRLRTQRLRRDAQKLEQQVQLRTKRIKEQKERLEKLSATRAQLYGIIGHDIRGAANAFRGMASKINYLLKKNDMDHALELAEFVENSAEKLNNQLDDLLEWAQQQEGELPFISEEHELKKLLEEASSLLTIVAKQKNIRFEYEGDLNLIVKGDYQMLRTIIRNLIENGIKFSFPDGIIKIKVFQKQNTEAVNNVCLIIEDHGIGMTKGQIKRIFSPDKSRTTEGTFGEKGTGLGMLLIREMLDLHGAKLNIESTLGAGTKVEVCFEGE